MSRTLRVFISSPSDVRPERSIAQRVVERVDREFSHHFRVEAVMWEREPLVATAHFQTNITPPRDTDIVVVIFWSTLGMLLPVDQFPGPLSGGAVTGTEWEYEDAVAAHRATGKPEILVYRKRAEIFASLDNADVLQRRIADKQALDRFIRSWFFDETQASFKAALRDFDTPAELEDLLYTHLRELLLGAGAQDDETPRWHAPPFRGLLAFEHEHAQVFFGRTRATNELRDMLARQAEGGRGFVLVLGGSGSGKSSLVKAGLLPDLEIPGMIARVALCRLATLEPGWSPLPIEGLAAALFQPTALPELESLQVSVDDVAKILVSAPAQVTLPVKQALAKAAAQASLAPQAEARLMLFIDQFEEVFTDQRVTEAARSAYFQAINALARSGTTWIVATMRSDFLERLDAVSALHALCDDDGRYFLAPPSDAEIGQMIEGPTREAGLRFETDPRTGVGLQDVIREAAHASPGALPLLSFLLDQLWQRRAGRVLTFAAYREMGGLEGAIGTRAEAVLSALPHDVQTAFPTLLRALVTIRDDEAAHATARPLDTGFFPIGSPEQRLIDALTAPAVRLLTISGDGRGAELRLAHEALLTHWPRAKERIEQDRADLQLRARLDRAAAIWAATAEPERAPFLLQAGRPLAQAGALRAAMPDALSVTVIDYIEASAAAARAERAERERRAAERVWLEHRGRRWLLRRALVTAVVVPLLIVGARWASWLEGAELMVHDAVTRATAARQPTMPVLLVGATEADINRFGWPLPDGVLADLIERLAAQEPAAIGVDLYRGGPIAPGTERLRAAFEQHRNVFAVYKFATSGETQIPAPQILRDSDRAVFSDVVSDSDGVVRRGLLYLDDGARQGTSLALALALAWLRPHGIVAQPDDSDPTLLRLGAASLAPLSSDFGGYAGIDDRGYQIALDYRVNPRAIPTASVAAVIDGKVAANAIAGHVVLVGTTAESVKDSFATPLGTSFEGGANQSGIEIHARVADQLVRHALGADPPMRAPDLIVQIALVGLCGAIGAGLTVLLHRVLWLVAAELGGLIGLAAAALGAATAGWWLPVVGPALALAFSGSAAAYLKSAGERAQRQAITALLADAGH